MSTSAKCIASNRIAFDIANDNQLPIWHICRCLLAMDSSDYFPRLLCAVGVVNALDCS